MDNLPQRKQKRLKGFDYSQTGYYFVTICTHNRKNILCRIVGNDALGVPSNIGKIIINCWNNIFKLNDNIKTDSFCLMPNHIHGIIVIENEGHDVKLEKKYGFETTERWGHRSLQGLIRDFKSDYIIKWLKHR